jgi:hypothetical protein
MYLLENQPEQGNSGRNDSGSQELHRSALLPQKLSSLRSITAGCLKAIPGEEGRSH